LVACTVVKLAEVFLCSGISSAASIVLAQQQILMCGKRFTKAYELTDGICGLTTKLGFEAYVIGWQTSEQRGAYSNCCAFNCHNCSFFGALYPLLL
jgi:hypothetical protein